MHPFVGEQIDRKVDFVLREMSHLTARLHGRFSPIHYIFEPSEEVEFD